MAKYRISITSHSNKVIATADVESSSLPAVRTAANQFRDETGGAYTSISKESSVWGWVAQRNC